MNTPQQVAAVKDIIKIKNKILRSSDLEEIAALMQNAIDVSSPIPANDALDSLDKTKSKAWNIISVKKIMKSLKENTFINIDSIYAEATSALLRLSMVFVKGGMPDVNKILADSFLKKSTAGLEKLEQLRD